MSRIGAASTTGSTGARFKGTGMRCRLCLGTGHPCTAEAGDSVCLLISCCSPRLAGLSLASGQGQGQGQDTYSYRLFGPLSRGDVGLAPSSRPAPREGREGPGSEVFEEYARLPACNLSPLVPPLGAPTCDAGSMFAREPKARAGENGTRRSRRPASRSNTICIGTGNQILLNGLPTTADSHFGLRPRAVRPTEAGGR